METSSFVMQKSSPCYFSKKTPDHTSLATFYNFKKSSTESMKSSDEKNNEKTPYQDSLATFYNFKKSSTESITSSDEKNNEKSPYHVSKTKSSTHSDLNASNYENLKKKIEKNENINRKNRKNENENENEKNSLNLKKNPNKNIEVLENIENHDNLKIYKCETCEKTYKTRGGLYKHTNNKHSHNKNILISNTKENQEPLSGGSGGEGGQLKQLIETLIDENKKLHEKVNKIADKPNTIINQTNNNQKTFNIIQFLNTDCKDAMNLTDFIRDLVITFQDLEQIEEHGYLSSVKDSLIMSLNTMEKNKRPIHCTDIKRKQFYVKDDDKWEKDTSQYKLDKAIGQFNITQLKTLSNWKKEHPEWIENDDQQNKVNKLNSELTSLYSSEGEKLKNKIITDIGNVTNLV